jgi:hypothetical protein
MSKVESQKVESQNIEGGNVERHNFQFIQKLQTKIHLAIRRREAFFLLSP